MKEYKLPETDKERLVQMLDSFSRYTRCHGKPEPSGLDSHHVFVKYKNLDHGNLRTESSNVRCYLPKGITVVVDRLTIYYKSTKLLDTEKKYEAGEDRFELNWRGKIYHGIESIDLLDKRLTMLERKYGRLPGVHKTIGNFTF